MTAAVATAAVVLGAACLCRGLLGRAAAVDVVGRLGASRGTRRLRCPERLRRALAHAALPFDPDDAWDLWLASSAVLIVIALVAGGPGLSVLGVVVCVLGPAGVLLACRERSARQVDAALPGLLEGIARSVRSGASLGQALAEASVTVAGDGRRLAGDLARVVDEIDRGTSIIDAVERWAGRCPTAGVRLSVAALSLASESGGAAARAMEGVAATLRANLAVNNEVRAQAAQARLSALVIAVSPLAFGALAAGTDSQTASFLLRNPLGLVCLVSGLLLDAAAAWWMHRITAVPA